jgi:hypothetical protein
MAGSDVPSRLLRKFYSYLRTSNLFSFNCVIFVWVKPHYAERTSCNASLSALSVIVLCTLISSANDYAIV